MTQELLEQVNGLGVPLMTPDLKVDVSKTLAAVVKSHDTRLWENFAALLASVSKKYPLEWENVRKQLKKTQDQKAFSELLALSKAMYDTYHVQTPELNQALEAYGKVSKDLNKAAEPLRKASQDFNKAVEPFRNALAHAQVPVNDLQLSTARLRRAFEDYLGREHLEEKKERAKHDELSLEYALSQVFSPKQKELFNKKLNGEKLTKTEREYFSRAVKKKAQALANSDLHRLAQKVLE